LLYATPRAGLTDLTVVTDIQGTSGLVRVTLERGGYAAAGSGAVTARFTLRGHGAAITAETPAAETAVLKVPDAALWSPAAPNLYDLSVELVNRNGAFDRYTLPVGIRTVAVEGDALLLNGRPVLLKGFGRHEDFPVTERVGGRQLIPHLALPLLGAEHHKYPKPIVLTEFGADTIPGCHAQPPEMFGEEYQAEMMTRYVEALTFCPSVSLPHENSYN
jgi:beta-galactosidase/beta-glucuronidase